MKLGPDDEYDSPYYSVNEEHVDIYMTLNAHVMLQRLGICKPTYLSRTIEQVHNNRSRRLNTEQIGRNVELLIGIEAIRYLNRR